MTQEEQRDRKRQQDREKCRKNLQRTQQLQDAAYASTQLVVETVMENDEERQNLQRTQQSQDAAYASTQLVVETVMENDEEIIILIF